MLLPEPLDPETVRLSDSNRWPSHNRGFDFLIHVRNVLEMGRASMFIWFSTGWYYQDPISLFMQC